MDNKETMQQSLWTAGKRTRKPKAIVGICNACMPTFQDHCNERCSMNNAAIFNDSIKDFVVQQDHWKRRAGIHPDSKCQSLGWTSMMGPLFTFFFFFFLARLTNKFLSGGALVYEIINNNNKNLQKM